MRRTLRITEQNMLAVLQQKGTITLAGGGRYQQALYDLYRRGLVKQVSKIPSMGPASGADYSLTDLGRKMIADLPTNGSGLHSNSKMKLKGYK